MQHAKQPQSQSRRQHQRIDLRMSAEVRTSETAFTATTRDLSEGGAGLSSDRPLEEGQEVVIGLFLVVDDVESDTPPLWVKARVAWCAETDDSRYNAGVRFEVITNDQRAWLRQVLATI
jgi:c-di-GMP-binding flagellar brake protein YcgR